MHQTYKGYWWLPTNPEKKVAGILEYIPNVSITLEIFGTFTSSNAHNTIKLITQNERIEIIHGETSEAKEITLFNCFSSGEWNTSTFPLIHFSCTKLLIGKLLDNYNLCCFFKAYCKIPELSFWCPPKLIQQTYNLGKKNINLKLTDMDDCIAEITIDNLSFQIFTELHYTSHLLEPKISQCTKLRIVSSTTESISSFLHAIHIFEQFLSFVCLSQTNSTEIDLYSKDHYEKNSDNRTYTPIHYLFIQDANHYILDTKHFNPLIRYETIQENLCSILKFFTNNKEFVPIREHLVECIKRKRFYSSVDFLIVVQAIECFWWRFRESTYRQIKSSKTKKTTLKVILEELITEFKDIKVLKIEELSIINTVNSRHYYSHYFDKNKKSNIVDGYDLYKLNRKLRILLICCTLSLMNFTSPEINDIITNCNNSIFSK